MIKAWEKVREMKVNGWTGSTSMMLSIALKEAWAEVKSANAIATGDDYEGSSSDFTGINLTGTVKQIKFATDILNGFYSRIVEAIQFEQKIHIDDVDTERVDYYSNLNVYVSMFKKALDGNTASSVIRCKDKFEVYGNVYRSMQNFITSYNKNHSAWVIKHAESKLKREFK